MKTRKDRAIKCLLDANSALKAKPILATDSGSYVYRAGTLDFLRADKDFAIGYAQSAIDQALRILQGQE